MPDGKEEFVPKSEDEIRQEVTEEFDFNEDSDKERIEKLTKERLDHQKELSTAIQQKKTHREKREAHENKLKELGIDPETGEKLKSDDKKDDDKQPDKVAALEKTVDQLQMGAAGDFSESIQKEIRGYASLNKISYKEAAKSEFVRFLVQKEDTTKKNEDAALGGGKGNQKVTDKKLSETKPADFKHLSDEDWAKKKQQIREGK